MSEQPDGGTPCAMEEPPAVGEVRTYIVRARCTGEHGPIERKDGEMRYTRTLSIQAAWESGKQPPNTDEDQPSLFDETDGDEDQERYGLDESDPEFSHNGHK